MKLAWGYSLTWLSLVIASAAPAAVRKVLPGESIQKAVQAAQAGDTIEVAAGTYHEAVVVDKERITLRGIASQGRWPVLDGENTRNDGVIGMASGFHIEGFRIQNYKGNGVMTQGANDVVMRQLEVRYTGIYGLYPTRGKNILVEDNVVWGIADAAIYIGMCEDVDVLRNEVFASVAGIEAENSTRVLIERNVAHDNAGGILAFNLPGLPVKHGELTIIRNNIIVANNHKNFGAEGSVVSGIPSGSGIILQAADKAVIENNVIQDNQTAGILLADHEYLTGVARDPEVEPNPDHNRILANEFLNNGSKPKGAVRWVLLLKFFTLRGRDILSTGTGQGNCLQAGVTTSVKGENFPACIAEANYTAGFYKARASHATLRNSLPPGEVVYESVCAGCHAFGMIRVGPPLEEIQKLYAGNPEGIVRFAAEPHKVRPHFPVMPPQAYLGEEKLKAVAQYLLRLKKP